MDPIMNIFGVKMPPVIGIKRGCIMEIDIREILRDKTKRSNWSKKYGSYLKPKIEVKCSNDFIDKLYDDLFESSKYQKKGLYKPALNCIVANLIDCGRRGVPLYRPYALYHTDQHWANQTVINNILKDLTKNGYCNHWPGFKHPTNDKYSFSATYFPTEKIMNKHLEIKPKKPENCLLLFKKDPKKRRVFKPYIITPQKQKLIDNINKINTLLEKSTVRFKYKAENVNHRYKPSFENQICFLLSSNHVVLLPDQTTNNKNHIWVDTVFGTRLYFDNEYEFEISKDSLYVYRSFCRGRFIYGGRFYTPVFQGIPSKWRKTITIDGEDTIELDYSAHHIRLLYHRIGLDFNGEAYVYKKSDVENKDKRQLHKYIAMIAINALNKKQTIAAVHNSIEDDFDNGKYTSEIPDLKTIEKHYNEFIEYHKLINKFVSNDEGIKLQCQDSKIMNNILIELCNKNIVGLPIHDSVIVKKKHKEILKEIMTKEYLKITNKSPIVE